MNWKDSPEIESYLIESNFHLVIGKVLQGQAGFWTENSIQLR